MGFVLNDPECSTSPSGTGTEVRCRNALKCALSRCHFSFEAIAANLARASQPRPDPIAVAFADAQRCIRSNPAVALPPAPVVTSADTVGNKTHGALRLRPQLLDQLRWWPKIATAASSRSMPRSSSSAPSALLCR
jgi:hypothetical protein